MDELPAMVATLATACGFEVHGWNDATDDMVIVQTPRPTFEEYGLIPKANRPVVNYMGSRAEAIAFMTAWSQCVGHKVAEVFEDDYKKEKVRRTVVPFTTNIPIDPAQSAQLCMRPQAGAFRGERIAIPAEIAKRFSILDIKVGNNSTFTVSGEVPAELFAINVEDQAALFDFHSKTITMSQAAKEQFGRAWSMPVCQVAMDITMVVVNTSSEPSPFCAIILGRSANNW